MSVLALFTLEAGVNELIVVGVVRVGFVVYLVFVWQWFVDASRCVGCRVSSPG